MERAILKMKLAFVRCFARYFQQAGQVKLAFEAATNNHPNLCLYIHPHPWFSLITFFGEAILKDTRGQEHKFTEFRAKTPQVPQGHFQSRHLKELREVVSKDHFLA